MSGATSEGELAIRVDSLRKRLGPNQALDGITTEFTPGKLHGLIGPEGAGKTTLILNIIGLLHPDEGSVSFFEDGRQVALSDIRDGVAYMPQRQSLYPDLSVAEHLEFFRDLYLIPQPVFRQRREELLEITRLGEFQDRAAGKLSGGMYKKLGLMCALLQSPRVVFLDEPTNGVDPISRREFWELLYRLREKGILIVLSTAYMDEAERCSEVHVMEAGRLIARGEPRALLAQEKVRGFDELFIRRAEEGSHGT